MIFLTSSTYALRGTPDNRVSVVPGDRHQRPHLAHMLARGNYLPKLLLWIIPRWTPGMHPGKALGALDRTASIG